MNIPRDFCRRCGTCCRKGGPTLHLDDRPLVEDGTLPLKTLVTYRRGESVHDPFQGQVVRLDAEIIKIKGQDGQWTCLFFNPTDRSCDIYAHRPLECRRLHCWDTAGLERVYATDRLTRRSLVAAVEGLADLIDLHERRCGYKAFSRLARDVIQSRRPAAAQALGRMVALDDDIRRVTVAKGGLDPLIADFLFGRPLEDALRRMGIVPAGDRGK